MLKIKWKAIKECEGYYISEQGEVLSFREKNTKHPKGYILKPRIGKQGYARVYLTDNQGKRKDYKIHRLVATYYLDNPSNLPIVNHKDGNKTNNHISNLEWCTYTHNSLHSYATGLCTQEHRGTKVKIGDVIYPSILKASESLGVSRKTIYNRIKEGLYLRCD